MGWQRLDVLVDDDIVDDLKGLPRGTQDAIFVAIYRYADSGHGGQVAYQAPGSVYVDELHVDGLAIFFSVVNRDVGGPVMIVSGVTALGVDAEDEA